MKGPGITSRSFLVLPSFDVFDRYGYESPHDQNGGVSVVYGYEYACPVGCIDWFAFDEGVCGDVHTKSVGRCERTLSEKF